MSDKPEVVIPQGQPCSFCGFETSHTMACPLGQPPPADLQDKSSLNDAHIEQLQQTIATLREQKAAIDKAAADLAFALDNSLTKPYFSCCKNGPCDECRIAVAALAQYKALKASSTVTD